MTVSSELSYKELTWNGAQTTFAPGIKTQNVDHIHVRFRASGQFDEVALGRGTHYSATLDTGGIYIMTPIALPAGEGMVIFDRVTPALQPTPFVNLARYDAPVHEQLHDVSALRDAELARGLSRTLKFPNNEAPIDDLPPASEREGMMPVFDSEGNFALMPFTFTPSGVMVVAGQPELDAKPVNNNVKVMTALQSARLMQQHHINAKRDFGCKGDDATDDYAAGQAAIDAGVAAGVPVFFPPGVYRTSQTFTKVNKSYANGGTTGPHIYGARGRTIFKPVAGAGVLFGAVFDIKGCPSAFHVSAITKALPCKVTAPLNDFTTGMTISFHSCQGMMELNSTLTNPGSYVITVLNPGPDGISTTNEFTLATQVGAGQVPVDSRLFGTYTGGGYCANLSTTYYRGGGIHDISIDGTLAQGSLLSDGLRLTAWLNGDFSNISIDNMQRHGIVLALDGNYSLAPGHADYSLNYACLFKGIWITGMGGSGIYDTSPLGSVGCFFDGIQTTFTGGTGIYMQSTFQKITNSGVAYAGCIRQGNGTLLVDNTAFGLELGSSQSGAIQNIRCENIEFESNAGGSWSIVAASGGTLLDMRHNHSSNFAKTVKKTIQSIAGGLTTVVTANGHGAANGDIVKLSDCNGVTELDNWHFRSFLAANVTANTLELQDAAGHALDSTGFTGSGYVPNSGSIYVAHSLPDGGKAFGTIGRAAIPAGILGVRIEKQVFRLGDINKGLLGVLCETPLNAQDLSITQLAAQNSYGGITPFVMPFVIAQGFEGNDINIKQNFYVEQIGDRPVLVSSASRRPHRGFLAHMGGGGITLTNPTDVNVEKAIRFADDVTAPQGYDFGGFYDTVTGRFCPPAGTYTIGCTMTITASNTAANSQFKCRIRNIKGAGSLTPAATAGTSIVERYSAGGAAGLEVSASADAMVRAKCPSLFVLAVTNNVNGEVTTQGNHNATVGDLVWFEDSCYNGSQDPNNPTLPIGPPGMVQLNFNNAASNFFQVKTVVSPTKFTIGDTTTGAGFGKYYGGARCYFPDNFDVTAKISAATGTLFISGQQHMSHFRGAHI